MLTAPAPRVHTTAADGTADRAASKLAARRRPRGEYAARRLISCTSRVRPVSYADGSRRAPRWHRASSDSWPGRGGRAAGSGLRSAGPPRMYFPWVSQTCPESQRTVADQRRLRPRRTGSGRRRPMRTAATSRGRRAKLTRRGRPWNSGRQPLDQRLPPAIDELEQLLVLVRQVGGHVEIERGLFGSFGHGGVSAAVDLPNHPHRGRDRTSWSAPRH